MGDRDLRFLASVSAIGLIGAAPAFAQQVHPETAADSSPQQSTDAPFVEEDIVVNGFRSAETKEIAVKRSSIEISDGISSDDLGRIPDLNIGEAMQRIPGIQINREAEGREATVSLRGLPGEYARTTMNGVTFAEPILQGANPFGAYLSDVFSGVRVEKSQLAHSIAGGLSGNIDLQIQSALARKDGIRVKLAMDYNELGKRKEPNGSIGGSYHLSENFAVFGTFAYKRENFRRDSALINAYGVLAPVGSTANAANYTIASTGTPNFSRYLDYYAVPGTCNAAIVGCVATPGGTGAKAKTGVLYPNQTRQYMRYNKGEQMSGSAGLEWKSGDRWTLGLVGLYTNRNQNGTTQSFQTLNFIGNGAVVDPTSDVKAGPNGTYYVDSFNFSNVGNITDNRIFPVQQRAWGLNGTIDYEDNDWKVKTTGTYSKAFSSTREMYTSVSNPVQTGVNNGANGFFASGGGNWDNYLLTQSRFVVSTLTPKTSWTPQAPINGPAQTATNYSNYFDSAAGTANRTQFRITGTQSEADSTLYAVQQDFERKFEGPLSALQLGLRWERSEFVSGGSKVSGYGINAAAIGNLPLVDNPDFGNFFGGDLPGASSYWKVMDVAAAFRTIGPATVAPGTTLNEFGLNNEYADDNNVGKFNFSNRIDVMSAYAEAKLDTTIAGMPLKGSFGIRYEATTRKSEVLNRFRPYSAPLGSMNDFAARKLSSYYDYWLPSGILILEPARDFMVRFAAYRTYVRPHPRQFSPVTLVGAPDANNTIAATLGNPDLTPYTGTSYDLSFEWYNRPGGLIALNLYQKRFSGLVQQISGAQSLCPADGGDLGLGPLALNGSQCVVLNGATDQTGQAQTVTITGFINAPSPITVRGVEANIKQDFDFLPGFLSNLGGGVSYGYTEIGGKLPNGQDASLSGVSKHNVNLIGYYETDLFGVRLTYNYRSSYDVQEAVIFGFGGAARKVAPRGQLDGSATLNVNDNLSLNFSAFNITNAVRKEYQGIEQMVRRIDYDGRTYRVALNVNF